jgi:hypothetical protein
MQTEPSQAEPAALRISYWALERMRQAYPERFDHTIQALRISCRVAYKRWRLIGLLLAWATILWQLQVTLPYLYGLPSLWRRLLLASKRAGARPADFLLTRQRAGVRLYYRRRRPSRRELALSTLALLALLPMFFRFIETTSLPGQTSPNWAATHTPSAVFVTPTQRAATPQPLMIAPATHGGAPAPQHGIPGLQKPLKR